VSFELPHKKINLKFPNTLYETKSLLLIRVRTIPSKTGAAGAGAGATRPVPIPVPVPVPEMTSQRTIHKERHFI
jgi:hypothetical protein